MIKYSIIIPTLNEEEGIAKVLCSIPKEILSDSEVLVVDSSTDMTPEIACRLGAKVIRPIGKGKGNAMREGVKNAHGNILIFLDGDGTDPPQYIPKVIKKLENYDMVLGARGIENDGDETYKNIYKLYHSIISPIFWQSGLKLQGDPLAGFRAMRRATWHRLGLISTDFLIETEMNVKSVKLGLRVGEVSIPHIRRSGGLLRSKFVNSPNQWVKVIKYVLKQRLKGQFGRFVRYSKPLI